MKIKKFYSNCRKTSLLFIILVGIFTQHQSCFFRSDNTEITYFMRSITIFEYMLQL